MERGMRLIGGQWKGSILWHLKDGPVRFNELSRMLGEASKK
ncbi:winged helix-turn-helix transcriptional regulator [Parendozoicomonas haliclonae]|uniref:HxlR-like helix-turn-helix n=1 Tax=Parendozoicomonas haliclonae TaxID=1960125 RepID=A0A1X7AMA7_9GAMM|nr:HxlR-like helix-turn-helix [Parendozoicomonas haliclonae]